MANWPAEFGEICRGKLWSLLFADFFLISLTNVKFPDFSRCPPCKSYSSDYMIQDSREVNTVTARDNCSRPSYSMLRARGTSQDVLGIMQLANKPAYYSSYIATIFSVVYQGTCVGRENYREGPEWPVLRCGCVCCCSTRPTAMRLTRESYRSRSKNLSTSSNLLRYQHSLCSVHGNTICIV